METIVRTNPNHSHHWIIETANGPTARESASSVAPTVISPTGSPGSTSAGRMNAALRVSRLLAHGERPNERCSTLPRTQRRGCTVEGHGPPPCMRRGGRDGDLVLRAGRSSPGSALEGRVGRSLTLPVPGAGWWKRGMRVSKRGLSPATPTARRQPCPYPGSHAGVRTCTPPRWSRASDQACHRGGWSS